MALALAYLLGGLPVLPETFTLQVAGALQALTLSFAFTLGLDLVAAVALWVVEQIIIALKHP
jgi:uncharacterized membrane protein